MDTVLLKIIDTFYTLYLKLLILKIFICAKAEFEYSEKKFILKISIRELEQLKKAEELQADNLSELNTIYFFNQ